MAIVRPNETEDERILIRRKKYPAIGAGEIFAPVPGEIQPAYHYRDLRAKLTELICSEVFLVTSPANLDAAAYAYRELMVRFGVISAGSDGDWKEQLRGTVRDDLTSDLMSFGESTSVIANPLERRSIILVPAMTSRTYDYTVLGQASYLASGLTTVFCNAVDLPFGSGRSCFIGHGGWGKHELQVAAMPGVGPYHGVLPGVFRPFELTEQGCLGKEEQAVVIADIDTQFSVEGKPRPQMLPPPLRLVAHLPLLESWNYAVNQRLHKCRCNSSSELLWADADWITALLNAIRPPAKPSTKAENAPAHLTTVNSPNRSDMHAALEMLAKVFSKSKWMELRSKQFAAEHAATPEAWPPPAAVDWLLVDLGSKSRDATEWPKIETPPYADLGEAYLRRETL